MNTVVRAFPVETTLFSNKGLLSHHLKTEVTPSPHFFWKGGDEINLSPFSQTLLSSSVHRFAWTANSASFWHVPFAAGDAASLSPPPLAPSELASAAAAAL